MGHNVRFGGSVTEEEKKVGGELSCRGSGMEQNLKFGGSVVERSPLVEVERNKIWRVVYRDDTSFDIILSMYRLAVKSIYHDVYISPDVS